MTDGDGARVPLSFTVAMDGPAAAGKGTIAKAVAARFGLAHLDTGLLYRAVAARCLAGEVPVAAARGLLPRDLKRTDLRTLQMAQAASKIAARDDVRTALVAFQRRFARRPGGAVLDGRDIGTVICPEAEVKLFITATPAARARRRHAELVAAGMDVSHERVAADMAARDARDSTRATAPLRPAHDALVVDTSALDTDGAIARVVALIAPQIAASGGA